MKRISIVSILLMNLGILSTSFTAQERAARHHPRYRLVDLGTLGGPASYFSADYIGGVTLNKAGAATGSADTADRDPNGLHCDRLDCFIDHAFRWEDGKMIDLGALSPDLPSDATAINDRGWVAGLSQNGVIDPATGAPEGRAVLWTANRIINLGTLGGAESAATQINDRGQVLGFSSNDVPDPYSMFGFPTQTRTFVWEDGQMRDLGTLGGPDSTPFSINNRGLVAGSSYLSSVPNPDTTVPTIDPFLWEKGKMIDLGTLGGTLGFAQGLNSRGQVIGVSALKGNQVSHPFVWSPEKRRMEDLGTLGGNNGSANWINDNGEVAGSADLPGSQAHHAFLWRAGRMIDLGTQSGDPCSVATAINSSGQVVGTSTSCGQSLHAFLWEDGTMIDLNSFIPANFSLRQLVIAMNINDRGVIYGVGVPAEVRPEDVEAGGHVFLLIPCEEDEQDCVATR
jgi:probable HAF family extracellular repeat protein